MYINTKCSLSSTEKLKKITEKGFKNHISSGLCEYTFQVHPVESMSSISLHSFKNVQTQIAQTRYTCEPIAADRLSVHKI